MLHIGSPRAQAWHLGLNVLQQQRPNFRFRYALENTKMTDRFAPDGAREQVQALDLASTLPKARRQCIYRIHRAKRFVVINAPHLHVTLKLFGLVPAVARRVITKVSRRHAPPGPVQGCSAGKRLATAQRPARQLAG